MLSHFQISDSNQSIRLFNRSPRQLSSDYEDNLDQWQSMQYERYATQKVSFEMFLFEGPIMVFIAVMGVVTNWLTITIMASERRTSFTLLMIVLALSDVLFVLSFAVWSVPLRFCGYYGIGSHWLDITYYRTFTFWTFIYLFKRFSTFTTVIITAQRFIVVWKPMEASYVTQ
jgi:hypothetical protein